MMITTRAPFYWERYADPDTGGWRDGRPDGADLAAMRRAASFEPGAAPDLWPLHAVVVDDRHLDARSDAWQAPASLAAEHHALVLYGYHQQSQSLPVHRPGVDLGEAMWRLRISGRYSTAAVDHRFYAAATAQTVDALAIHLRGLVTQLRSLTPVQPLDYSQLVRDLASWHEPLWRQRVRRRWGLHYERFRHDDETSPADRSGEDDAKE